MQPAGYAATSSILAAAGQPQRTRRKKIMPARGPRRLLWVVVVTMSAYRKGCGRGRGGEGAGGHAREGWQPGSPGDLMRCCPAALSGSDVPQIVIPHLRRLLGCHQARNVSHVHHQQGAHTVCTAEQVQAAGGQQLRQQKRAMPSRPWHGNRPPQTYREQHTRSSTQAAGCSAQRSRTRDLAQARVVPLARVCGAAADDELGAVVQRLVLQLLVVNVTGLQASIVTRTNTMVEYQPSWMSCLSNNSTVNSSPGVHM